MQCSVWIDGALLAGLRSAWGFGSDREVCEAALRYLAKRTAEGLPRLELP